MWLFQLYRPFDRFKFIHRSLLAIELIRHVLSFLLIISLNFLYKKCPESRYWKLSKQPCMFVSGMWLFIKIIDPIAIKASCLQIYLYMHCMIVQFTIYGIVSTVDCLIQFMMLCLHYENDFICILVLINGEKI